MDVHLPEKKMNDLPMEDESTLVGESDLNFVVTKENCAEDYIDEDVARSNDGLCHEIPRSHHEQPYSSALAEINNDVVIDRIKSSHDQESLQSPSKENHLLAEAEEFIGSNLCKSPLQVEAEALHHEIEYEASAHSMDSMKDPKEEEKMEDGPHFPPHDELLRETFLEEEISDLPTESRKLDTPHSDHNSPERTVERSKSPETVGQSSLSPKTSPVMYQSRGSQKPLPSQQGLSNSSGSHEHKHSSSRKRSDLSEEGLSGRLGSRHTGGSSLKHVSSSSPKKHYSPPNHRRRDRSVSRSPHRQRDSSSGYKRDYRYRSRSRSPNPRDHHRRSPRRRYSPRRRSPPSSYRSRQRSPRKRPWSPPHNRNTGVGKPGRNLFVAGFSFLTTERELERKFSRFGRVRDIRIVRDKRSGDSRGFGFLSLERDEEADAAIKALDKTEWNGRIVLVEKSKSH